MDLILSGGSNFLSTGLLDMILFWLIVCWVLRVKVLSSSLYLILQLLHMGQNMAQFFCAFLFRPCVLFFRCTLEHFMHNRLTCIILNAHFIFISVVHFFNTFLWAPFCSFASGLHHFWHALLATTYLVLWFCLGVSAPIKMSHLSCSFWIWFF